jgi:hypothetical protein
MSVEVVDLCIFDPAACKRRCRSVDRLQSSPRGLRADWSARILARLFDRAAPPSRSVFAPPADALTYPGTRKRRPANQAFPDLLFSGSLQL